MDIKDKLKQRRLELGLTLDDVARIVNVSGATISRWESGDIENMRRDKIALLAKALQVSPSFIMEWEESDSASTGENLLLPAYLSFAKNAQDEGILPEDIEMALNMIKQLKKRGDDR